MLPRYIVHYLYLCNKFSSENDWLTYDMILIEKATLILAVPETNVLVNLSGPNA